MIGLSASTLRKSLAAVLAAALTVLSPGLGCYEALASMVAVQAGKVVAVSPGAGAGAGIARVGLGGAAMRLSPAGVGLGGTIMSLSAVVPMGRGAFAAPAALGPNAAPAEFSGRAVSVEPGFARAETAVSPTVLSARAEAVSRSAAAAANAPERAFSTRRLLAKPESISMPAAEIARMPASEAKGAGSLWMDRILGRRSSGGEPVAALPSHRFSPASSRARGLNPSGVRHTDDIRPESVPGYDSRQARSPQGRAGSKILGAVASFVKMAAGAGAVYGLHAGAVFLFPAVFGTLPIAALWAVASAVLILPMALHHRYRLGLRDSPRLSGVKHLHDIAIGALLGAMAVAAPVFLGGSVLEQLAVGMPLMGAAAMVVGSGTAMGAAGRSSGGAGGIVNAVLTWIALTASGFFLALVTPFTGTVAALPLTLGGVLGMGAIAALATVSFFLGFIIRSAESGRPFSVPGAMQALRFPSYTWVMTGVVFALLTGYSPVWTNVAFTAWMLLSDMRLATVFRLALGKRIFAKLMEYRFFRWLAGIRTFDFLFVAFGAFAASTGFSAPISFLVLAFAPERAAIWTEDLLGRLLPAAQAAPSSNVEPVTLAEDRPERFPKFNYWFKTALALGLLAAFGFVMGGAVFGYASLLKNLGVAALFSVIPLIFSKWLIKKLMKAEPLKREDAPAVFKIMEELRESINAERRAKGQKEIPMPEMVRVPMPVPNAFATGFSPMSAMVGVTEEMMDMTLNPRRAREMLIRMFNGTESHTQSFKVYRMAIRGSIPGLPEDAGRQAVIQALQDAPDAVILAIGTRALRGVMGHEFNHVMHRDMILGTIGGTLASGISFAAYGVLWAVGHAEAFLRGLWDRFTGRAGDGRAVEQRRPARRLAVMSESGYNPESAASYSRYGGSYKPEAVDPATAGAAVTTLLGLAKVFAALWAPVLAKVLAMSSQRTREHHADEGGGYLTGDHEALALGLGLLTAWRPPAGFIFGRPMLPRLAALAHQMTVNPLKQLHEAGVFDDELDGAKGRPVTKADDWFFELFLTHPNTTERIERLYRMAAARQGGR